MIYLSCFSISILAAVLLIQGTFQVNAFRTHCCGRQLRFRFSFQLNRFLLIYWILVAVLRIILQTLLLCEIFIYDILQSSSYVLLYTLLEVLDYGEPQRSQHALGSDFVVLHPLFSGSHRKFLSGGELVQAAEAARSERLHPTEQRRSVMSQRLARCEDASCSPTRQLSAIKELSMSKINRN